VISNDLGAAIANHAMAAPRSLLSRRNADT